MSAVFDRAVFTSAIAMALALAGCGAPAPPDDSYLRAHEPIPVGEGFVKVEGKEHRLGHVYYWAPYSFADRAGLGQLLGTGVDPAPVESNSNLTFRRHRTYPMSGWTDDVRVAATYATGDDRRTHGTLTAPCRAEVTGDALSGGFLSGTCEGGEVRLAFRAWQVTTPFQLTAALRERVGPSLPDWPRTIAHCRARGERLPLCGDAALEKLTAGPSGRQQSEQGGGTWILAKDGRMLVALSWLDGEELLVFDAPPADDTERKVAVRAIVVKPELAKGEIAGDGSKTVTLAFDGSVLLIDPNGPRPRRVVPDPLVVTGIAGELLAGPH